MALKAGYNITNFVFDIDGEMGGYLSSFTPPTYEVEEIKQALGPGGETKVMAGNAKIGDVKFAYNMSQTGKMWTVMESVLKKNCTEFNMGVVLADQNYKGKRRIDMTGCLVKELSFPKLDAKDGKKHMEMTFTAVVEKVDFKPDSNAISGVINKKAKNWLVSNFEPSGMPGGIAANSVINLELPKFTAKVAEEHTGMMRLPTRHYAAWEVSGLKTEHSSIGFDAVKDLCVKVIQDGAITDEEYTDWGVDIKDQTMKKILASFTFKYTAPKKFTWSPELKGGQDGMATCSVDWVLEECNLENQHMG
jgi:hypothetical protein